MELSFLVKGWEPLNKWLTNVFSLSVNSQAFPTRFSLQFDKSRKKIEVPLEQATFVFQKHTPSDRMEAGNAIWNSSLIVMHVFAYTNERWANAKHKAKKANQMRNIFSVSCWMRKKNKKSQMKSTNIISVCVFANKRWVVSFYRLFSVSWPRRVASYLFDYAACSRVRFSHEYDFFWRLHRIANELKSLRDVDGSYEPTVPNRTKHCWRSNELFRACRLETAWLNEFWNGSLA